MRQLDQDIVAALISADELTGREIGVRVGWIVQGRPASRIRRWWWKVSGGADPSPGALYLTLHRLERQGVIEGRWGETTPNRGGARVRWYRLRIAKTVGPFSTEKGGDAHSRADQHLALRPQDKASAPVSTTPGLIPLTSLPGWSVSPDDEVGTVYTFGGPRMAPLVCVVTVMPIS